MSCCTDLFVYLDDALICSRSPEQHKAHLQQLFQHLQENGLVLSPTKCKFGVDALSVATTLQMKRLMKQL